MKKIALILSAIIALTFSACSDKNSDSGKFDLGNLDAEKHVDYALEAGKELGERIAGEAQKYEEEQAEKEKNFRENQTTVSGSSINVPEYGAINIKSYGIEYSDLYESDIITITADFTNNNEYDYSFGSYNSSLQYYQNGIVLNQIIGDYDSEVYTEIKPGKTIEVSYSYKLRDTETTIEIETTDPDDNTYTTSFELK